MLTPVRLRGWLGTRFGTGVRRLDIESPAEAIQALCVIVPGFEAAVRGSKTRFKVLLEDVPVAAGHLVDKARGQEIRIVPVVKGAKSDGEQFLEGAAMIALAMVTMGGSAVGDAMFGELQAAGLSNAAITASMNFVGYMGASMAIGGISRMLVGAPSTPQQASNSMLFSGAQNTVAQGIAVPCCYGDFYITPPLISESLDTESFSQVVFGSNSGGNGGGGNPGGTGGTGTPISSSKL